MNCARSRSPLSDSVRLLDEIPLKREGSIISNDPNMMVHQEQSKREFLFGGGFGCFFNQAGPWDMGHGTHDRIPTPRRQDSGQGKM